MQRDEVEASMPFARRCCGAKTYLHVEVRGVAEDRPDLVRLALHVDLELLALALLGGGLELSILGLSLSVGHGGGERGFRGLCGGCGERGGRHDEQIREVK